ncbi:MAG: DUF559 domain-containing protein [Chloroflexi bacterium]|nr:DUF559 domain-containing protein [Chloroflexota bacterium]
MPELQRFVWEWNSIIDRLAESAPRLSELLARSCRPIAAERRPEGRLVVAIGCWVAADRRLLDAATVAGLETRLKRMLDEKVQVVVTGWPGGDGEPDVSPDPLAGLPADVRAASSRGPTLHRWFFANAVRRGMELRYQYPVLHYRLDFADVAKHVGIEIGGWCWRRWSRANAAVRREREQSLLGEGWRIHWFTGEEVLTDVGRCLDVVASVRGP